MNKYQLVNLLKENEVAYQDLKKRCVQSINGNISVEYMLIYLDSIFSNCFDLNIKKETCDKVRHYIANN